MNYLAHAFLSFGDAEILTGNMIADHVKGLKALDSFPGAIANGIRLHRKIDAFVDFHAAVARAKVWFREPYHLYAGAVLDTLWDHFLANDPAAFPAEKDLKKFTLQTYALLERTAEWHPDVFTRYFPHMSAYDWLYNYRSLQGARRAMEGVGRRALYMPPLQEAYEIFIDRYHSLENCYSELMGDLLLYVKKRRLRFGRSAAIILRPRFYYLSCVAFSIFFSPCRCLASAWWPAIPIKDRWQRLLRPAFMKSRENSALLHCFTPIPRSLNGRSFAAGWIHFIMCRFGRASTAPC